MKTVAIVGGGFSGTVVAAGLLARSELPIRVCLFDRTGVFGAGIAYATNEPNHFLNVPAAKMSAFEDDPGHFTDWLNAHGIEQGDGFLPRRIYRRYLQSLLDHPSRNPSSELRLHPEAVVGLEGGARIHTASERFYWVDEVVLATGYLSNRRFEALSPFEPNRWPAQIKEALIVGSGLTALDGAASILTRFPGARVTLVSRHGKLPEPFTTASPFCVSEPPCTVREIVRWLRAEIERSGNWVAVFDAMRPRWEAIWQNLSEADRRRFLRHLRSHFDRYRHRIPPGQFAALSPYLVSGQLKLTRAEVESASPFKMVLRGGEVFKADLVLDASGASCDGMNGDDPLMASGSTIHVLGPPLRGVRWETTAVPEIRRQAAEICSRILGN